MKNIKIRQYIVILGMLLIVASTSGQETGHYHDTYEKYNSGKAYFDRELYGQAMEQLNIFVSEDRFLPDSEIKATYFIDALSMYYIAGLRLQLPEAETDMANFIAQYSPGPLMVDAIFEMGDYYYNERQYASCIEYFEMIDIDALPEIKMSELTFKKGYCHFVRKEFKQAQYQFSYTKDIQNQYFYPTNYYYGMCEYFDGDYKNAIKSFQRVENNEVYREQIPYYICQIYFAQEDYNTLLSYGENIIRQPNVKKNKRDSIVAGSSLFSTQQL